MSGAGAPDLFVDAQGVRVAIIAGSWHEEVMAPMIAEAQAALERAGAESELVRVAGSFELPLAAQVALAPHDGAPPRFDAAVCLGVIIRGGTPHFDYVCNAVTDGLARVQLDTGRPVGFGVLTTDDEQQALDRSGRPGAPESKGREAAEAALHLVAAVRALRGPAAPSQTAHGR